jgi:hypothetical protein
VTSPRHRRGEAGRSSTLCAVPPEPHAIAPRDGTPITDQGAIIATLVVTVRRLSVADLKPLGAERCSLFPGTPLSFVLFAPQVNTFHERNDGVLLKSIHP